MNSVRVKLPNIEFEYVGELEDTGENLHDLITKLVDINASILPNTENRDGSQVNVDGGDKGEGEQTSRGKYEGSINTLASKLKPKSGREMLIAAAAHLVLYQGKERFTKDELMKLAQSANSWQAKWMPGASTGRTRLVASGILTEHSKDVFTLPVESIQDIERKIGTQ